MLHIDIVLQEFLHHFSVSLFSSWNQCCPAILRQVREKHPCLITQTSSSSQEELKILCLWSFRSYQLVIPGGHSEGSSTVTRKVLYYTIYLLVWEAPTVCACKPRHLVISKNDRTEYQLFWFYALPTPMKSHIWLKNCSLPKQTEILKSTTGIIKTLKTTKIKVIDSKKS